MNEIKDGGWAFPQQSVWVGDAGDEAFVSAFPGMSLRDWFAGQALAGQMASEGYAVGLRGPKTSAARAYEFADAMIAERDKGGAS
jgi:hypothetical protein